MESLLSNLLGVVMHLDDILVTGTNDGSHLSALEQVLQRLKEAGLRLRKGKCVFMAPSVVYLCHQIDKDGLGPESEKVQALQRPQNPRTSGNSIHIWVC